MLLGLHMSFYTLSPYLIVWTAGWHSWMYGSGRSPPDHQRQPDICLLGSLLNTGEDREGNKLRAPQESVLLHKTLSEDASCAACIQSEGESSKVKPKPVDPQLNKMIQTMSEVKHLWSTVAQQK